MYLMAVMGGGGCSVMKKTTAGELRCIVGGRWSDVRAASNVPMEVQVTSGEVLRRILDVSGRRGSYEENSTVQMAGGETRSTNGSLRANEHSH